MVRSQTLASGSKGNAVLVEVNGVKLLLDCGLNYKKLRHKLAICNTKPEQIHSIYITHSGHTDHYNGPCVEKLKRNGTVIFKESCVHNFYPLPNNGWIKALPSIHDTPCVSFVVSDGNNKMAFITDSGDIPCDNLPYLTDLNLLIIECNHDTTLLQEGPDPIALKLRIAETHLSNDQAFNLVNLLAWHGLKYVIGCHLSARNNSERLVKYSLESACEGYNTKIMVAQQDVVGAAMICY